MLAMSVDYIEGSLPVVWRLPSVDEELTINVWPDQLYQSMPLDLSVRHRHRTPEPKPEILTTGTGSMSAFKKSILKRYSK